MPNRSDGVRGFHCAVEAGSVEEALLSTQGLDVGCGDELHDRPLEGGSVPLQFRTVEEASVPVKTCG